MKKEIENIFNALDDYKRFCVFFGHKFDEADLFSTDSYSYTEYIEFKKGKKISNNWIRDAKIYERRKKKLNFDF